MSLSDPVQTDYDFKLKDCYLGAQMLFVAFGAFVLVPLLTDFNPNVALFTAGVGTIIFQVITKGKVPVFLASSFAFIALATTILVSIFAKGILKLIPILCGIAAGYIVSLGMGLVKFKAVKINESFDQKAD